MRRQTAVLVGIMCVVVAATTGCMGNPVVGVVLPTSGERADYGESIESGIRLAISDAREQDLLPSGFEVVWADSESQPLRAVEEVNAMVNDRQPRIKLLIGGATNSEARALLPTLKNLNLMCLSPMAQASELTVESKHFYRLFPNDELEGVKAASFLFDKFGDQTLIYVGSPDYSQGLEREFVHQYEENDGGQVLARIDIDEADWETQSRQALRAHRPRAVYIADFANGIVEVLRHLKQQRFGGSIVTSSSIFNRTAIDASGDLTEMAMFPLSVYEHTSEDVKDEVLRGFVRRYMETYQRAPDIYAAHGYDAMRFAIEALSVANPPETDELKKAFHFKITEYRGVTGIIQFDDRGDVKHNPIMYLINKDGSVESYRQYIINLMNEIKRGGAARPTPTPAR
ncbi:MAG: ABC transporter substrate-binding protein [bacterium]|nr:ABC transporter substrate-binding protein [bacterium]